MMMRCGAIRAANAMVRKRIALHATMATRGLRTHKSMGEPNGAVNALLAEFRSVARSIKEAGGTALKEWTLQDLTVGLAVLARQQSSLLAESQSSRQFLCLHDFVRAAAVALRALSVWLTHAVCRNPETAFPVTILHYAGPRGV